MTETGAPARRGRGRRPAGQVREQIVQAAGQILLQEGMSSFTIEKVASRAGASRMTIYKWWPSRGALAFEGFSRIVNSPLKFADTGNIDADLTAWICAYARLVRETNLGRVLSELIGVAQNDPDLAKALLDHYAGPRRQIAVEAINLGIERGQLRSDIDPATIVDQLVGAAYFRMLWFREPITDDYAKELVHNLMAAAHA
jgi:AcrR family transcriptional regulator